MQIFSMYPTWPAVVLAALQLMAATYVVEGIGVNWGTQASQNLHPATIVQMLKDNKIDKIKLFDSDPWTVKHFAGTGIEVMLGIPNNQLKDLAQDYDKATDWVKQNLTKHIYDGGVNIRYVAVGNEPLLKSYNGSNLASIFPALRNIQKAINEEGLGDKVKATSPQNADVYDSSSNKPSDGQFRSDIRDLMYQIVQFLQINDAPFTVNIYPFLSLYLNPNFPVEFAFFDGGAKPVNDNGTIYSNMLDANIDTLVWALRKTSYPDVKIIIGEIGWPTDGDVNANVQMAKKFYDGFFKKMATKQGTPIYPKEIEYYLFSLTDENQKSVAPGDFERHWGLFKYDGKPKFPMDFSGQGHDKMPVAAKNVTYLESKWCVFNPDVKNMDRVPTNMDYACSMGDCTTLNHGSSCNKLDETSKISYAFNMYFQMNNQDVESCNFDGLAKVVDVNASADHCLFPIAIESDGGKIGFKIGFSVFGGLLALLLLF
ncbi:Glucan endo-1,3-beta-D-glucosidase [Handroanthus impetiginosus]|uniref:glucan endo-1,3-beta-D-glucosidase n=1 Tax=Handroanthus impetiginosus TaxID=429701 RepID=A0A2G9IAV6_9LAMI|nr:Glucan endo-1,3-beta-D-glucosidase [Handroanthus impetiginosus]